MTHIYLKFDYLKTMLKNQIKREFLSLDLKHHLRYEINIIRDLRYLSSMLLRFDIVSFLFCSPGLTKFCEQFVIHTRGLKEGKKIFFRLASQNLQQIFFIDIKILCRFLWYSLWNYCCSALLWWIVSLENFFNFIL